LYHAPEVVNMVFPSDANPSEVLEPSKEAPDLPASSIAPKRSSILGFCPFAATPMRCDHLNSQSTHFRVQRIAVVGFVPNDPFRKLNGEATLDSLLDQGHFMRRSTVHVDGDRKTRAVCNGHDFGPLAPFRFPNSGPPFLAGEKDPSIKASRMSSPPRTRRSSARARRISSNTPSFDHFWRQRWQVWYGGYRSGRSFQGAPVRSIHRMPSSTSRGCRRGRPRGSDRLDTAGIKGSNTAHCSLVKSIQHILCIHYKSTSLFYETCSSI